MLQATIEQSLIFAIMVLGVYISFRILNFPDMTVDGTFPLGAAISAKLLTLGVNPYLTLIVTLVAGAVAGAITGLIHVKLKVKDLLAGILVMTALYSVNLRVMKKSNIPLFEEDNIFNTEYSMMITIVVLILISKFILDYLLKTKFGFALKALGDNENLIVSLGLNEEKYKIYGLMIANAFVAFSGAVLAQYQGFADVGMGTGIIVIGLASIIIGDTLFGKRRKSAGTTIVIIGSILYRGVIALTLSMGMDASDLKLITSVIVIVILWIQKQKDKRRRK
ncbi:ABC transporter permease [Fusobacterium nucleatum subsp. nucleatum ATCC 25586]|uniref:ABC transporter integral membrane protein n=1 Tax=Fusobacterium nucleatum subsp. nucleatum (strain ATCC 25586 / DSM 15643 / BCRC 10681 / CIP 101130 / JCM 8532 / KCTC 2640 / LMG 13131 / VPI 4355) TaxID=190304 RepID=Q8RHF6_FUSNN|nr:ABC transporter permease [Fusobacterium nucleatum]AAL94164.1 ABC transporter integral membrane protein [Fusobacterium nucleatum subsp. nucleatum ATCC 25586]AVQ14455.1 ABC transporter permease [Fusobacterium nucleatum subsp. nucleatum ATCC 25586]WMS29245.1 ABC transporter permease [Fusobacterium nucleatum]